MRKSLPCIVCSSKRNKRLFVKGGLRFVKCSCCGLVYINPREESERVYEKYKKNKFSTFEYYRSTSKEDYATFREWLSIIEEHAPKGRLLDIGCGVGTFLKAAHDIGWNVEGIDINKKDIDFIKKRYGLNVHNKNILDLPTSSKYDVVTMIELIEHLPSPRAVLHHTSKIIKKGGWLFLNTPNVKSLSARLSGKRWWLYKPSEHLYYFSPKTIRRLLNSEGFDVIKIQKVSRKRNLYTVIDRLKNYSRLLSKVIKAVFPKKFLERIIIKLSIGDMFIVARKR